MKVLKSFKRYNLNILSWLFPTLFYIHSSCLAQVNIQSADVASINRFIDVPVEKSTGIPNIQIPLYTFKENGFEIPIALNYHAGGTRVDDMSSSVGLNWSHSCDFVISRAVKDKIDELGYYANNGYQYGGYTIYMAGGEYHVRDLVSEFPNIDLEPDIFYFSIKNFNGRFIIDKNREVQIVPHQDLKIDVTLGRGEGVFKFKITAPDGTQYFFEGFNEHGSSHGLSSTQDDLVTAWHVNKIITPNLDVINFGYIDYGYEMRLVEPFYQELSANKIKCPTKTLNLLTKTVDGFLLKSISSRSARVEFNYSTNRRQDMSDVSALKAIEGIQIFDNLSGTLIKQFRLMTSYFISNQTQFPNYHTSTDKSYLGKRLRLDEVRECDASGNCLPGYRFSYNKYNTATRLPYIISTGRDHWGYYNGQDLNKELYASFLKLQSDPLIKNGCPLDNRDSDPNFKMAFALDEIISPESGITTFKYECVPSGTRFIGGIRVKEIKNIPGNGQPIITKSYEYYNANLVDGAPVYCQFTDGSISPGLIPVEWKECFKEDLRFAASSEPINFSGELSGNYLVHEKVIERQAGNGSIEYYFDISDLGNNYIDVYNHPYVITNPVLKSGKLIKEIIKDNQDKLLRETNYVYNSYNRTIVNSRDAAKVSFLPCSQQIVPYTLFSGACYLSEKTINTYSQESSDFLTEKIVYEYKGIPPFDDIVRNNTKAIHHFVTAEKTYSSDGSIVTKRYKYPLDYKKDIEGFSPTHTWSPEALGIKTMLDRWTIDTPVEAITTISRNGVENAKEGKLKLYHVNAFPGTDKIQLNLKASLDLESSPGYSSGFDSKIVKTGNHYSFSYNNNYKLKMSFDQYDGYSNLLEYHENDDVKSSFIWGYSHTLPVAQARNAALNEIYYEGFEENGSDEVENDITLAHSGLKYFNGDNYSVTWTKPNTRKYNLSYWGKSNGEWKNVTQEYSGATVLSGKEAYDDIHIYPSDAEFSTYTYRPLIGITSSISNSQILHYEYDAFNRLANIKNHKKDIIKNYSYNYNTNTTPFYNTIQSKVFQKNDCPNEAFGDEVTYTVEARKYTSLFSQEEANLLALDEIQQLGQAKANAEGECNGGTMPYYNVLMSKVFNKECPNNTGPGTSVTYTVAAGKYSSMLNRKTANKLALQDIEANGQANANQFGICTYASMVAIEQELTSNNSKISRVRFYKAGDTAPTYTLGPYDLNGGYYIERGFYKIVVDVEGSDYNYVGLIITAGQSSKYTCLSHEWPSKTVYEFEFPDLTQSTYLVIKVGNTCGN